MKNSILLFLFGITAMINNYRYIPLRQDPVLNMVAQCRANYLYENNLWTHNGLDRCFRGYGIDQNYGEVLAKDFQTDYSTVRAWYNSPTHKWVMTLPLFDKIGVAKRGNYTVATFRK